LQQKETPVPNFTTNQKKIVLSLGPQKDQWAGRQTDRKMEAVPNKGILVLRKESLKS